MRKLSLSVIFSLVLASSTLGGPAVPIPVENFSFELPGTTKQTGFDSVPGWKTDGTCRDSGVETGYTPTDGLWTAFLLNADPAVWQLTTHTIAAGDVYQLKVDARITYMATDLQVVLYYDQAGTRVPLLTQRLVITDAMQEYTVICTPSDIPPESVGKKLGLEFQNVSTGSDNWAGVDNIRLDLLDKDPRLFASQPDPADGTVTVTISLFRWTPGENAVLHSLYVGTDANLTDDDLQADRQALPWYYLPTGLTPGARYYWRVDEIEKDGVTVHTGDVWTFVAQDVKAYYPQPAHRANDVSPAPTLTWMPGLGALGHRLYFSDNLEAVSQAAAEADKGTFALGEATFAPGPLETLSVYYWRVDESLGGDSVTVGPVWSFATCQPVDDFESYNDEADQGTRIYETWTDGYADGSSGSIVGNVDPPFAEQTIVHGGLQSMPLDYNNISPPFYSEAWREFAPAADWTVGDVNALVLYVRGKASNGVVPLYITLEDSSQHAGTVVYPDTALVTATAWTAWKVPLSDFAGVNLTRVRKMYIGLGDKASPVSGGSGRLYLDDIGLTRPAPVEP
jgi:hypothetical protein